MYIKIANISKLHFRNFMGKNILTKGFTAKVGDIEEGRMKDGGKYGKFLLVNGRSTVYATAFGETYELWKKVLKIDKVFKFPPETFSCKTKFAKRNSNSTCKYDMIFLRKSRHPQGVGSSGVASSDGDCDTSSLRKVSQLLRTSRTFTRKLKSIKLSCGEVYRYLGCKVCSFSIPRQHTDGRYYCKGSCNNKISRRSKIGVVTERKICFTIYNVKLSDDTNETIESVVIFNSASEILLKKRGESFDTDNEAKSAWLELTTNNCFDITLKRNKKKKDSTYSPAVLVHSVDNVIAVASSTCTNIESGPLSEYSYDAFPDRFEGTKMDKEILPEFPKFEVKLQHTKEQFRDLVTKYRITSKPPGLVLLINNFNFPNRENENEKRRLGSEIDITLLQCVFCEMGFEIYGNRCHMDIKTKEEFVELLNNFRAELCRRDFDSIFVVISSHGRNNEIELSGHQGDMICVVKDIMIPFSDSSLPKYEGKPKVFMPITCQDLGKVAVGRPLKFVDNRLFNMLVCCPSLPGYAQMRVTTEGSLFVNRLVHNLTLYARTWHLVEILDKVQMDMHKQIVERNLLDITVSHYFASTFGQLFLVPAEGSEDDHLNPFRNMEIDCI